jgi:lipoprotein NlpI/transglutaminase-like putative cysteine protease
MMVGAFVGRLRRAGRQAVAAALGVMLVSAAAAQGPGDPGAEPLREIALAAGAFVRGAPVPAWVDLLPLPDTAARGQRPVVVRLADTHVRAGPQPAYVVNRAEQVNDAAQLGQIGQRQLHFNPAFQRLLLHRLTVVRGAEHIDHTRTAAVRFLQRETSLEQGIVSGVITASIVLPDVRVGDTLHIVYSIEGDNPIFAGRYAGASSWEQPHPVQLRRVTVSAPQGSALQWRWVGGAGGTPPRPRTRDSDGWRHWTFEERDLAAVDPEPYLPPRTSPYRWLQYSEYARWSDVVDWALALFPADSPLPPELDPLLARWRALPDPAARVSAALQWVQNDIRYWSVALGESSHRPALPAEVLARRWGDCKDKSLLLARVLQVLGIEADPVLVSLQSRDGVQELLPSPAAFDHVVVRVRLDGRDHWLDATRSGQASRLDRLGQHLEGSVVLPVRAGTSAPVAVVSPNRPELHASEIRERFVVESLSGAGRLQLEQRWVGLQAESLRAELPLMDAAQRRQWALGPYERRYPGITLDGDPVFEDDVTENRIVARVAYRVPRLVQDSGPFYAVRYVPGNFAGSFVVPDSLSGRRFPLIVPSWPTTLSYQVEVVWPETVSMMVDPRTQKLDTRYFSLESQRSFRGNVLRHSLRLRPLLPEVPAADVARLVDDIRRLDDLVIGAAAVEKTSLKSAGVLGLGRTTLQEQITQRLRQAVERSTQAMAGDRLQGEDRAEALCTRAESRADLGEAAAALADAMEAVRVAPQSPRVWQCRSHVYFVTGEFARSASDASRAIGLGGDAVNALLRRGQARFYDGQLALAAADFAKAAADTTDTSDRLFAQLWQLWTLQRLKAPVPAELVAAAREQPRGAWPRPALAMLAGALSVEQLLAWLEQHKAGDEREMALAEAWFYIGQQQWAAGDREAARRSFEKTREKRIAVYIEHVAAGWELKALGHEPR